MEIEEPKWLFYNYIETLRIWGKGGAGYGRVGFVGENDGESNDGKNGERIGLRKGKEADNEWWEHWEPNHSRVEFSGSKEELLQKKRRLEQCSQYPPLPQFWPLWYVRGSKSRPLDWEGPKWSPGYNAYKHV